MDDNNYMNNDNRSSGTPDNTGVFGQSSETANGSDTYSQPQDTYNQPTDTYNQSVSQQESGNAIWTVIRPDRQHRRICQ